MAIRGGVITDRSRRPGSPGTAPWLPRRAPSCRTPSTGPGAISARRNQARSKSSRPAKDRPRSGAAGEPREREDEETNSNTALSSAIRERTYHGEPPVGAPELGVGALPAEPEHGVEVGTGRVLRQAAAPAPGGHVGRSEAAAAAVFVRRPVGGLRTSGVRQATGGPGTGREANKRGEARASCLAGLRFHATREGSRTGDPTPTGPRGFKAEKRVVTVACLAEIFTSRVQ